MTAWTRLAALGTAALALGTATPAQAQLLRGRVVDADDGRAVPQALIRLVDEDGKDQAVNIADSAGTYVVSVPGPGTYRIVAERVGFEPFRSPLLSVASDRTYPVDIELDRAPVPIPGLVVTGRRFEELERGLHLMLGQNPKSLRNLPILRPAIEDHLTRGHNVTDMVRWSNLASVVVKRTLEGPCFQWRGKGCMPVFLNGVQVAPEMVPILPLNMVEVAVILGRGESIVYPHGGVMLYTAGWIR